MQVLTTLILMAQIAAAIAMIGLVLVQHGKGADMGASFGGGSSGSLFGATGSANFLSRSTAVAAAVFFVCTLALAYLGNHRSVGAQSSVLDQAGAASAASAASAVASAPSAVASGAALIPAK
jgi:preprotein translocase subunit SecG